MNDHDWLPIIRIHPRDPIATVLRIIWSYEWQPVQIRKRRRKLAIVGES